MKMLKTLCATLIAGGCSWLTPCHVQAQYPGGGSAYAGSLSENMTNGMMIGSHASIGGNHQSAGGIARGAGFNHARGHALQTHGLSQAHGLAIHQGPGTFGQSNSWAVRDALTQQAFSTTIQGGPTSVGGSVNGSITIGNVSRSFSRSFGQPSLGYAGSGSWQGGSAAASQNLFPIRRRPY